MLSKKTLWEAIGGGPANFPNYDTRTGLGYGTQSGFHAQRQYQGTYPYKEPDQYAEDEEDEEGEVDSGLTQKAQNKVGRGAGGSPDQYNQRRVDPFYFVGAATSLSGFSEAIARNNTRGSISPLPSLYKNREGTIGGVYSSNPVSPATTTFNHYSTLHGYSKASLPEDEFLDPEEDEAMENLRKVIRAYHHSNLLRK